MVDEMTQQDDITQRVLTDDEIQALWDEACKDSPQAPGWNRHIRFARALLSQVRAPVADKRFKPPFDNCSFRMCDLPGQCRGEGRCHHPASAPVAGETQERIEQMAVNRYRPVPDGKFSYKVVAGDGSRSLYTGTKDSCLRVAAKLTEAFLDGAFSAANAAPQASAEDVRNGTASKRYSAIDFDGWIAMHCDCDDLTAYERKLARDAWDAAMASHQGEPVDLPRIDADRLRAIAASGSQTAMSNALLNVARALKTQADKDGGQQRAGDELTHLRAENQRLRNGVDQDIAEVDRLQALYDSEWRKCKKLRAAFDHPVFAFLLGEGQLHGVDFGERAPGAVGKWWWRKDLRAALSAPQAEQGERDA